MFGLIIVALIFVVIVCAIVVILFFIVKMKKNSTTQIDIVKIQQNINRLRGLIFQIDILKVKKTGDSVTDASVKLLQFIKMNKCLTIEAVVDVILSMPNMIDQTTVLSNNYILIANEHFDEAEHILEKMQDMFGKIDQLNRKIISILSEYNITGLENLFSE